MYIPHINSLAYKFRRSLHLQAALIIVAGIVYGAVAGNDLNPGDALQELWPFLMAAMGAAILTGSWLAISRRLARSSRIEAGAARSRAVLPFAAISLLPILYLPFVIYRTERSNILTESIVLGSTWQTLIVLLLSLGLTAALLAYAFPTIRPGWLLAAVRRPGITLAAMIVVWIAAASTMDILKTVNLNEGGANTAQFVECLRNVFSDKAPLYSQLLQEKGSSILGVHASYIWFFVYPLFRIWPDYQWLLILSNGALALAAIPIYLLSRQFFGKGVSLLFVAVYLLNRAIISQPGAADMSEERFLPLLLISTFYFYQVKRFIPFAIFAVLAMFVREDAGIVLALLGIYALFKRDSWKWSLLPMAAGSAWFVLSITWLIPHFNPAGMATRPGRHYGELGGSGGEIIRTVLLKPWIVVQNFFSTKQHIATIYGLWQSFGFGVPILSGAVIIALPALAETLLVQHPNLNHFNVAAIAAAIFPSFILGTVAFEKICQKRWNISAAPVLIVITLFSTASLAYSGFAPERYMPRYNYDTIQEIMAEIPDDASAMMPIFMLFEIKEGQNVRGFYQVPYQVTQKGDVILDEDYIVIDSREVPEELLDDGEHQGNRLVWEKLSSSTEFTRVLDKDDLQLYIRTSKLTR